MSTLNGTDDVFRPGGRVAIVEASMAKLRPTETLRGWSSPAR
jgi:hypothetical protein